jgi:adenylate cyclase
LARRTDRVGLLPRPPNAASAGVERRLAAIMAADIVGYSRLMGADEVGTLQELRAQRRSVIDPGIAARHGRIVKTTGDGVLAEFPSAVDAVACAIAIQRGLMPRNETLPEEKRLYLRIGINIGDIIVEAGDIFGDGVNVAARLETLCAPGGLCISRAVRDQIRDKLPLAFDDLGEQSVKNIARPVRAFGLSPQAIAAAPEFAPSGGAAMSTRRHAWIGVALVFVLAAVGALTWWVARGPQTAASPAVGTAPVAAPRASIAVLPFGALSDQGDGDYFADGLTEDIIGALGRFRDLSVISRGGVFAYKGKNPTPEAVGRDLKVRYVVEGSIRRSPERIRVSVSLTDTMRGAVLWSEKYDAEPKDVFGVQDQITRRISGALAVRVTGLELQRSAAKAPSNLEAYDLVLRGRDLQSRLTRAGHAEARGLLERAIALDPGYAPAYVGLGRVDVQAADQGWTQDPGNALVRAEDLARKAIALDDLSPGAHALLGVALLHFGDYDRALDELKRATELNGSDADAYSGLMSVRLWRGETQDAITAGELLKQFEPSLSAGDAFLLSTAYLLADRGAEAVTMLEQAVERNRTYLYANVMLAVAYAQVGRRQDAERQAEAVRQRFPNFSSDQFGSLLRDPGQREMLARLLKRAGL